MRLTSPVVRLIHSAQTCGRAPFPIVKPASDELIQHSEARLGQYVRDYLAFARSHRDASSDSTEAQSQKERLRQEVCTGAYYLLQWLLSRQPGWSRGAWFDGFYPEQCTETDRGELDIAGTFLWVEGQDYWWFESGYFSVRPYTIESIRYEIRFADADLGLRTRPHPERRSRIWVAPKNWMFTFEGALSIVSL
jgi:hypothetical protein